MNNIIVAALSDSPLLVVIHVIGDPYKTLKRLDKRYDAKTTAYKISKITDLVVIRYTNARQPISKYIDKMAAFIAQIKAMKTEIDEPLSVGLLVDSIDVIEVKPIVSSINTLAEEDITRERVS